MHVRQGFKVIGDGGHARWGQADDTGHGVNLKPSVVIAADDAVGHWRAFRIDGIDGANHSAVAAVFIVAKAVAVRHWSIIYRRYNRRVTVLAS